MSVLAFDRSADEQIQPSGPIDKDLLQDNLEDPAKSEAHSISKSKNSTRTTSSNTVSPKVESRTTSSASTPKGRTRLIELPATSVETTKDIDADKLCNLLEEWCTVETYRFLQRIRKGSKVAEQSEKLNRKLLSFLTNTSDEAN